MNKLGKTTKKIAYSQLIHSNMFDTLIIGGGPAAVSAGIYAVRREMKTLIVAKDFGGQLIWASDIENYPGFASIQAMDLVEKMKDHVVGLGVDLKMEEVQTIKKEKDGNFSIFTEKNEYQARTVIVTIGLSPRRLAISGEIEFSGRGVTYCANCDGPFYKGKVVAVVGGGNSALDAAEVMSKIASKVYLIHRREEFKAFDALVSQVKARENVEFRLNCEPVEIVGDNKVTGMKLKNGITGVEELIELDGVFIEVGRIASTDLVSEFADRDQRDQILVDEKMQTKTPGLFAAGDVVHGEYKQISIATGQGTIAALAAYQYLQEKEGRTADISDRSK